MLSLRLRITNVTPSTNNIIAESTAMGSHACSNWVKPHAPFKLSLAICASAQWNLPALMKLSSELRLGRCRSTIQAGSLFTATLTWFRDRTLLSGIGYSEASFDNLDLERAVEEARRLNRYEFLFMAAPLRVEKGTGSPLNPLAVF